MTTAFMIRPRLDGFLDWLRKKKPASEMISSEPKKVSKFDAFRKEPGPEARPSKFDKFRTEEEIAERALIERPAQPVAPEAPRSEFAVFAPDAPVNVPAVFQAFAPGLPAVPEAPKGFEVFSPEAPVNVPATFQAYVPQPPSVVVPKEFEIFIPTPEERALAEETHEEKELRQMELWKDLFPTEQTEEKDIFEAFAPTPQEMVVAEEAEPYIVPFEPYAKNETVPIGDVADNWGIDEDKLYVLPMPPREDIVPSAEQVARAIVTLWGPITLEQIWDEIRELYDDPEWVRAVRAYTDGSEDIYDAEVPKHQIEMLSTVASFNSHTNEIAALFGISKETIEDIGEIERYQHPKYGPTSEFLNEEAVYELEYELENIFNDAMEMLKPSDIPGHVILEHDLDWDGSLCINYVDFGERFRTAKGERFATVTEEEEEPFEEEEIEEPEEAPAPKKKAKKAKAKKAKKPKKKSKK